VAKKSKWRPFEEAREYVRGLGLSSTDWAKWCKSDERPKDIPTRPDHQYKTEWGGWGD